MSLLPNTVSGAMSRTDWKLLAEQKQTLIKACETFPDLDGILNWIDAIQDAVEYEAPGTVVWLG